MRRLLAPVVALFLIVLVAAGALRVGIVPLGAVDRAHYVAEGIVVGSFQVNSSTGNQSITGLGIQPKAILFWDTGQNTTDAVTDGGAVRMGWTDCTDDGIRGIAADDGTFLIDSQYSQSNNHIWRRWNASASVLNQATFVSCDSDGFTWNIGTTDGTVVRIAYMAIGGTGVFAKQGSFTKPNVPGSVSVSTLTFEPSLVLFFCGQTDVTSADSTGDSGSFGFSAMTATQQWAYGVGWLNGGNSSLGSQRTDKAIMCVDDDGSQDDLATRTSITSSGFQLNFSNVDSTNEEPVYYLALGGVQASLGSANQRTSNGTTALTGFGFSPNALLVISRDLVSSTTADQDGMFSIGAGDGTNQAGAWSAVDHGCGLNCASAKAFFTNDLVRMYTVATTGSSSTLNSAADLQSLDSDGATLNWTTTDATARQYLYLGLAVESTTPALVCWDIVPSTQTLCTTIPANVQDNITRLGTLVSWAFSVAPTISDGVKVTFNPNGTNAGINVGAHTADPSSLANGDVWYNSTSNLFKCRENGATVSCIGGSANIQTLLDGISTTQGVLLYYNGTDWVALSPGTSGHFLKTQGASANPTWSALPGGTIGDLLDWQRVRKASDESVTSSTTLQSDDELVWAVGANEDWIVEFHLGVSGATAGDIKLGVTVPTSPTSCRMSINGLASTAGSITGDMTSYWTTDCTDTGFASMGAGGAIDNYHPLTVYLQNGANSGNVQLRWAQLASSGTATIVRAGSYLIALRVN